MPTRLLLTVLALCCVTTTACANRGVTLVDAGQAKSVIVVSPRVLAEDDKSKLHSQKPREAKAERTRIVLRESIKDLALYLNKMSGAQVEIVTEAPPADSGLVPILVGEPAAAVFGPPKVKAVDAQGLRIVVTEDRVGLIGESDQAVSYAIYEVLDRLGCRWFMPSEMGEYVPTLTTITLPAEDRSLQPYTHYRGIWYADDAFRRRNRCGGLLLHAGHALEFAYLTKEDKEQHPEWIATVDGEPNPHRLKWSAPGVAERLADRIIERLDEKPDDSVSLSTDDGMGYDNSPEDLALDADDFDPSIQRISMTDRFVWFANKIIERVEKKHPEVLYGMLAYAVNTRPPVREKLHPKLVPQIAPITFSRAHPMTDPGEPNNKDLQFLVEGWGKAAPMTSYYFYCFFLAEVSAPNPMIRKWSVDIPIVYDKGACRFWQPETLTNFETSMHALYLGLRMAWDPTQDPAAIIDELHEKFYGHAASQMAAYWDHIDRVWVETPEYAGCGFGHLRRWTPEQLGKARQLMDAAKAAAQTPEEKFRVGMADDSLALFELFMKMRRDLADGHHATLADDVKRYREWCVELGDKYDAQYAFCKMPHTAARKDTLNGIYFRAFYEATYLDLARIGSEADILTNPPVRQWKYLPVNKSAADDTAPAAADFDDSGWKTTDSAVDTWSALGLHNYMEAMWYRTKVTVPADAAGRKLNLWIAATDGSAKVFVNGKQVPYVGADGKQADEFVGYCQPASFDITAAVNPGGENTIAIYSERRFMNELGTGGLLGPALIYANK